MGDICWECDMEAEEIQHHHVVPRSRGGTKTVGLCLECHGKAHHREKNMHTGELTKASMKVLKDTGKLYTRPPVGFTTDKKGGLKPTAEAGQILYAVKRRNSGKTLKTIAGELGWTVSKTHRVTSRWMDREDELKSLLALRD